MPDIHFECPKCNQKLDAPEELASQAIDCPICKETIGVPVCSIGIESKSSEVQEKPTSIPSSFAPPKTARIPASRMGPSIGRPQSGVAVFFSIILFLVSAGILIAGSMLVLNGLSGEVEESKKYEGSAIRQTVYAVQYGSGLIVIAPGFILSALSGIILKRSH